MGVRGLQTFLEKHCPEACYRVDISELANKHKRETGTNAIIVVDAQSCYQMWYKDMDWLAGYEIHRFVIRLRAFVESFKKLGIRLVFFFGGLNPEKKRMTWLERRRENLEKYHDAIDFLKTYGRVPDDFQSFSLPNLGLTISYILKYVLDCEVYMTVRECDEEILEYADQHKCFAIFGQDSDFVIGQVEAIVLSSQKFEIETMTTLMYDRTKLALHLGIRVDELPFLAILAGNDLIRFDTVVGFHRRIRGFSEVYRGRVQVHELMPIIGRYIQESLRGESLKRKFVRMSMDLFDNRFQVELLKISYRSYFVEKTTASAPPTDNWSKILQAAKYHYQNTRMPACLYSVLTEQILENCNTFEDLRRYHDMNALVRDQCSSSVLRPLRLRLYGILLFERGGASTVQEWSNDNVYSYFEPSLSDPSNPKKIQNSLGSETFRWHAELCIFCATFHHPGLLVLWSGSKNKRENDMRWNLFLTSIIHQNLKMAEWQSVDKELLFTTLSVYYLFSKNYLNESEMDAVLVTIATCSLYNQQKLSSISYKKLNFRAANISITLNRTFGLVLALCAACGYPVPLSSKNAYLKFEGKLFQRKFRDLMKKKYNYETLCENHVDSLELFYQMRGMMFEKKTEELDKNVVRRLANMRV